jgi:hypothetical protein
MGECHLQVYDEKLCTFFALGRNAMYAACKSLGLREGDEVLTPAFNCDGSLQPFRVLGYKLVFYRSDAHTFLADIDDIKKKINGKTRLLHIVNHFGIPQAWEELLVLRQKMGVPILEDNAYSLFSKFKDIPFGTFGDMAIFSLRKNLPMIDGGMLRINNPDYQFKAQDANAPWCYPSEYPALLRCFVKRTGIGGLLRRVAKEFLDVYKTPPPLYSDPEKGYPDWPARDFIGDEFSCDYLRPMSGLAARQLAGFTSEDFAEISGKKRLYYKFLSDKLANIRGIKVLWPELPESAVPFSLSLLVDANRDGVLAALQKKYDVMAWPTLSKSVLEKLREFPELGILGRKGLQLNLPSDRVRRPDFTRYLENLVKEMECNIAG